MIDWWVTTVGLTFLPMLLSVVIGFCRWNFEGIYNMIGEGELVLTSFLVIIQGMLEYRKKECIKKKKIYKIYYYYFLWLITILELVAYVTLKVNTENNRWVVVGVSILCTIASIGMSWQGKKLLMGGAD